MAGITYSFHNVDKEVAERRAREKEWERQGAEDRAKGEMLVGIGKECAKCHVKAYVPFVCAQCGLSFCSDHRFNHNCTAEKDSTVPTWFVKLFWNHFHVTCFNGGCVVCL